MALYPFYDTTENPGQVSLPAEAVNYNGTWIDSEVPQFRTLYVSGRESFSYDVEEAEFSSIDGTSFLGARLLPRTILVGYQVIAASPMDFRNAFDELAAIMSAKQVPVIFADDPNRYYVGTCKGLGEPEPGRLSVTAEMEIYCADPVKYAVTETTKAFSGGSCSFQYNGSYPARPKLEAAFSGIATSVAFTGADGSVSAGNEDAEENEEPFGNGSQCVIDCSAGAILVRHSSQQSWTKAPKLGDVSNEYEKMLVQPGANTFSAASSLYGTETSGNSYTIQYREAWL